MNKQDVKKLALECGFKLKEQPDGSVDLTLTFISLLRD